jgi:hypothetical protein
MPLEIVAFFINNFFFWIYLNHTKRISNHLWNHRSRFRISVFDCNNYIIICFNNRINTYWITTCRFSPILRITKFEFWISVGLILFLNFHRFATFFISFGSDKISKNECLHHSFDCCVSTSYNGLLSVSFGAETPQERLLNNKVTIYFHFFFYRFSDWKT